LNYTWRYSLEESCFCKICPKTENKNGRKMHYDYNYELEKNTNECGCVGENDRVTVHSNPLTMGWKLGIYAS
jgi:hypothetical protein